MKLGKLTILFAEDSEDDVLLLKRAIKKTGVDHIIHIVADGHETIEYLSGRGRFADRVAFPFPNVLFLDLKMPRKSGMDVLEWLCDYPACRVIPTVVFTSSQEPSDIKKAYQLGANTYFTKPGDTDTLVDLLKLMFDYWFHAHVPELPETEKCH